MEFEIEAKEDSRTVHLRGGLTFSDQEAFSILIEDLKQTPCPAIIIDLKDLESIDSAGLGMFILLRDLGEQMRCALSFRGAKDQVLKVLELANFQSVLTLEP